MEALSDTQWEVTIAGTGLAQSLLALALSRSGKKVLHVDKNPYYGGAESAFSLQEAELWMKQVNQDATHGPFEDAIIKTSPTNLKNGCGLGSSRSYTLSLSPHVIYTQSNLIPSLVSSKVYKQLEFQAVGSWWIYHPPNLQGDDGSTPSDSSTYLHRVPSSREDIFADKSISMKGKRMLVKFLRTLLRPINEEREEYTTSSDEVKDEPFGDYLKSKFQIPDELQDPLASLSLSLNSTQKISAKYAIPRIKRHLSSIGVFGPGFGGLLTKWGGSSEIAQVGCRALAVGGGVYVLNRGIQSIQLPDPKNPSQDLLEVKLTDNELIHTKYVVGSTWDLPAEFSSWKRVLASKVARAIFIVSSPLSGLFPSTGEGGPIPAGCVVLVPSKELSQDNGENKPVYLLIHSSETGECPDGQCVMYCSVSIPGPAGQKLIEEAVEKLLSAFGMTPEDRPAVLWSLQYTQLGVLHEDGTDESITPEIQNTVVNPVISLLPPSLDLAIDDGLIDEVRTVWEKIIGDEEAHGQDFLVFEDRAGTVFNDDSDDNDV